MQIAAPTWKATVNPLVRASGPLTPAVACELRRRERAEHGQSERSADQSRGVQQARGEPGLVARHALGRGDRRGHQAQPHAEARQHAAREHDRDVAAAGLDRGQDRQAGRRQQHPGRDHRTHAEPGHQPRRQRRRDEHRQRDRQERQPGLQRVVAQHLLQVQRHEEEHREQRRVHQHHDDVRGAQRRQPEDRQRHQRGLGRRAPRRRRTRPAGRSPRPAGSARRATPSRACRCGRSRTSARPGRRSPAARRSGRSAAARRGRRLRGSRAGRATITIAPSGTLIAKIAGQPSVCVEHAAEQRARRGAEAADRRPQAEAAIALWALRQRGGDDRQRRRRDDRAPEPLERPHCDQLAARIGDRASQRREGEQGGPASNTRRRPRRSAAAAPSIRNPANVIV